MGTADARGTPMGDLTLAYHSTSTTSHVGMLAAVNALNVLTRRATPDAEALLIRSTTLVFLHNAHRDAPDLMAVAGAEVTPKTWHCCP